MLSPSIVIDVLGHLRGNPRVSRSVLDAYIKAKRSKLARWEHN